jgi:uncharacterized protein (UPF0248 family)
VASEIRNTINKLLWDDPSNGEIVFVNRTRSGLTLEIVLASELTGTAKDYFKVGLGINAKYIPYHRVVEIRYRGGLLWKSRRWKIPE